MGEDMTQQRVGNRWFVVVGAILVQLCLGAIYAWSVFTTGLNAQANEMVGKYDAENPDKIEMSKAIHAMEGTPEIKIELEVK